MTYEASTRRVPCMSSTLDETTALRPFCDSSLLLIITNWTGESLRVRARNFDTKRTDAPDQPW